MLSEQAVDDIGGVAAGVFEVSYGHVITRGLS
jgi:hypothetical protein